MTEHLTIPSDESVQWALNLERRPGRRPGVICFSQPMNNYVLDCVRAWAHWKPQQWEWITNLVKLMPEAKMKLSIAADCLYVLCVPEREKSGDLALTVRSTTVLLYHVWAWNNSNTTGFRIIVMIWYSLNNIMEPNMVQFYPLMASLYHGTTTGIVVKQPIRNDV